MSSLRVKHDCPVHAVGSWQALYSTGPSFPFWSLMLHLKAAIFKQWVGMVDANQRVWRIQCQEMECQIVTGE